MYNFLKQQCKNEIFKTLHLGLHLNGSPKMKIAGAHCFSEKNSKSVLLPQDVLAMFGAHDLNDTHEVERVALKPKAIIIHEDWNAFTVDYDADISLLEFEKGKININSVTSVRFVFGTQ